jgi:hypothetical protein
MTRQIVTYGLVLIHTLAAASSPTNPYHLYGLDINALLPFSASELRAMHDKGVVRIEEQQSQEFKTIYFMDELGRLVKEENNQYKNGRIVSSNRCEFHYSHSGKLLARKCITPYDIYLDSVAYDSNDLITYYLASRTTIKGPRRWRGLHINQELKRVSEANGNAILVDSSEYGLRHITFNAENEVIRIDGEQRTDSISTEIDAMGVTLKKYWYRSEHPEFRLGQLIVLKDNTPLTRTVWDMIGDGRSVVYKTNYHYDENDLLFKTENVIRHQQKDLYTYYENALKMEHVTIHIDRVVVRRFRYWYN